MSGLTSTGRWTIQRRSGHVAELHALELPTDPEPSLWVLEATKGAVVLGSSQPGDVVDLAAAEVAALDVVVRRSGGGAVVVVPGDMVWVDVLVPAGDALWSDDVGLASHWLGEVWAEVVESFGHDATVHRGAFQADELGRLVCFGGMGPGEVSVDGAKVVGISQRRTRAVARFQCACVLTWNPAPLHALLRPVSSADAELLEQAGFGLGVSVDQVTARLFEVFARN